MHWFLKLLLGLAVFLIVVLFILSLPKVLPETQISNSQVSGLIMQNQVWQGEIRIAGDIWALPTSRVTIMPGTKVLIAKDKDLFNLDYLPWHLKSGINTGSESHGVLNNEPFWDEREKIQVHFGRLLAIGSQEMPITVKSDSVYGSPYDVNLIFLESGIISHTNLSNYRKLEIGRHVTIRDSGLTDVGECAICIYSGGPSVINNSFGNSLRESIRIYKASPRITDNLFVNLSGDGIVIDPHKVGRPVISFNTFEMPGKTAINILTGDEEEPGVISFNKFSGNSKIRIACDSKIRVLQNVVYSLVTFGGSGCGGAYSFGPNYWGSKKINTVFAEQINLTDKKFKVSIPSILNSLPTASGIRVR